MSIDQELARRGVIVPVFKTKQRNDLSFVFKGKSYLTKKPSELKKKSLRERLTGYKTQSEYEAARTKRKKETRVARMEKRKGEGKSYSAKNLASLTKTA